MSVDWYRLDGKTPVPCTLEEAGEWRWPGNRDAGTKRWVARDEFPGIGLVSTVFLGLDYNFGDGPPLLFETTTLARRTRPRAGRLTCTGSRRALPTP